jgi:hypothetical protein
VPHAYLTANSERLHAYPPPLLFPFGILQFNIFQFGLQLGFDPSILQLIFSSIMDATDPRAHCARMLFPEAFYNSFLN